MLLIERRQKDSELSSAGSVISSLRAEIERMRSEMASVQDRSTTETESLRAEVQRLSVHQRAASSEVRCDLGAASIVYIPEVRCDSCVHLE